MILVFPAAVPDEVLAAAERAVRRAGGDPRRMVAGERPAIDARGADVAALGRPEGVEWVLADGPTYPRAAKTSARARSVVRVGDVAAIGDGRLTLVAGPCAVESESQLEACARAVVAAGGTLLRGGVFKPRTSPYSFQGLGVDALATLAAVARRHGLGVVTEVLDTADVAAVAEHADLLQVGSRNMQNFALLRAVGRAGKPVLLKRGMSATLDDWLSAAEYVLDAGNPDVVLCERGVRSFDPAARNLLDLASVPLLRERTHLPVVVDPSHGVGVRRWIRPLARASKAVGAHGILVEVHPNPPEAKSDADQALTFDDFATIMADLAAMPSFDD